MNNKFINYRNIDINQLKLNNIIFNNNNNCYISSIKINETEINIKTDEFNLLDIDFIDNKIKITLEFIKKFPDLYLFFINYENKVRELIKENSLDILNFNINNDILDDLFKSKINPPVNLYSMPSISLVDNLNIKNNLINFDLNNTSLEKSNLKKNIKVKLFLNLSNIFFFKNKINININIKNIIICDNYSSITEYSFPNNYKNINNNSDNDLYYNDSEYDD